MRNGSAGFWPPRLELRRHLVKRKATRIATSGSSTTIQRRLVRRGSIRQGWRVTSWYSSARIVRWAHPPRASLLRLEGRVLRSHERLGRGCGGGTDVEDAVLEV